MEDGSGGRHRRMGTDHGPNGVVLLEPKGGSKGHGSGWIHFADTVKFPNGY